jgi:hypothetical protein
VHQGCTRLSSDPDETFFGLPRMSSFAGRFTTAGHPGRYLVFADKEEVPGSSPGSPTSRKYLQNTLFLVAAGPRAGSDNKYLGCVLGAPVSEGGAPEPHPQQARHELDLCGAESTARVHHELLVEEIADVSDPCTIVARLIARRQPGLARGPPRRTRPGHEEDRAATRSSET